jgi:hypothetical protein
VRKIHQIAALVLLLFLTALAAVTVQIYRHARDTNRLLDAQSMSQRAVDDALRGSAEALQDLQYHAGTYLLTRQADSLKAYRESLQDWQYEAGTLNLLSGQADRVTVGRFAEIGALLADEIGAIVALDLAGSHDAALTRLRTGPLSTYRDNIRRKELDRKALNWDRGQIAVSTFRELHRLIYCAGGLFLLGFLGLCLLLYSLGTKPAPDLTPSRPLA